jgi:hypothetical protein
MTDIEQHDNVQVFVGVDVGKGAHHAVAMDRKGRRLFDGALPNDETRLRAVICKLKEHGQVLLVVDQPATVGALPVAVARDEGVWVAYLPGLAMRRIADLHAGEDKTDPRDAYIIAEAAHSLPHALRSLKVTDDKIAELAMMCGFEEDLAGQITQVSNRIRGLLTQIHPAPERVIGPHLDHPAILDPLERYPSGSSHPIPQTPAINPSPCNQSQALGKAHSKLATHHCRETQPQARLGRQRSGGCQESIAFGRITQAATMLTRTGPTTGVRSLDIYFNVSRCNLSFSFDHDRRDRTFLHHSLRIECNALDAIKERRGIF